jgi:hypothetical protein
MALAKKQQRILDRCLDHLYSSKAIVAPVTLEVWRSLDKHLERQVSLVDRRCVYLSDRGLEQLGRIVNVIQEGDLYSGNANYSDIYSACRDVYAQSMSDRVRPDGCEEFLALLEAKLSTKIESRNFVVALWGIDIGDIDELVLGELRLIRDPLQYAESQGVRCDEHMRELIRKRMKDSTWLVGAAFGTGEVAEQRFRRKAELFLGMLSVFGSSCCERGVSDFALGVSMPPFPSRGDHLWFTWGPVQNKLGTR